jgi:hypothetical protein
MTGTITWLCIEYLKKCNSKIYTDGMDKIINIDCFTCERNHLSDPAEIEKRINCNKIKEKSVTKEHA